VRHVHITGMIISFVLFCSGIHAGGLKKYAGEFLYSGVGSRPLSLGGAYVAVANDVTAGFWNPAGLVDAPGFQAQFMHAQQFMSSIQYDYVAVSNRFENGSAIGLSVIRLGADDIPDTRNALNGATIAEGLDYSKISFFNVTDYAFLFSYARSYSPAVAFGVNIKLIYRDFYSESAYGLGFDLGVRYLLLPHLMVGVMARDLTTTVMAWSTSEKEYITPSLRPGVAYTIEFPSIKLYLQPSMDMGVLFESRKDAAQLSLGAMSVDSFWGLEIGYSKHAFLRFGYDDLNRFNAGAGVHINRLGVDYSYTNYDYELGNVHRISFHLKLNAL
jgi:hypothetical protein